VALVGPSGAGKTTLASLIPRFFDVSRGRVTIDGSDIREVDLDSLRDQVAVVTQEVFLFNDRVRDNIGYGRKNCSLEEIQEAARAAFIHGVIISLPSGYETRIGEWGEKLSGGQRQRLAIARAILKQAPILILDEATSALDSESERLVQEALDHLMENCTTLVIAHRLSTIRSADRIVVLEEGRLVEQGTHDDLLARGRVYRSLIAAQTEAAHRVSTG
jgi:ABC-type multidrug transport system fused ATPase/permease subunit